MPVAAPARPSKRAAAPGHVTPLHPKGNRPGTQRPYCTARQLERAAGVAAHFMVCFQIVRASATEVL